MSVQQAAFFTFGENSIRVARPEPPRARRSDPRTSHDAAAQLVKAESHCRMILRLYAQNTDGLTDAEVEAVNIVQHAWKRCSDLRSAGLISPIESAGGEIVTRPGPSGRMQQVCAITVEGWRALEAAGSRR